MALQEYLKENLGINEALPFEIKSCSYKKGERITEIGNVERNIYFIKSGIIEQGMRVKNEDKIIDFNFSNEMVTSLTSMLKGTSSDVYLNCLTDCEVQVIPYDELKKVFDTSIVASKFFRHFMEVYYLVRVKKEKDILTKTCEERYSDLIKIRPNIVKDISVGHIARYLGIHPNSLSRIRKNKNH